MTAFDTYFAALRRHDVRDSTEHTLRTALENLLNAVAADKTARDKDNAAIRVIHEAKRDRTGKGAPDFKFTSHDAILGYLENKEIGVDLDVVLKSPQITKYKQLTNNLLVTDYLDWVWLRDGKIVKRARLCDTDAVGNPRAHLDPARSDAIRAMLEGFYSQPPQKIDRAPTLALALATRCHHLRDALGDELLRQEKQAAPERLYGLYQIFKREIFQELSLKDFADAFAQTLAYGLFLARLNQDNTGEPLTLENVKRYVPKSFGLIRELVDFLDELNDPTYDTCRQWVTEILIILNTFDLAAIREDLSFNKRQGRLLPETEEERVLFAKDPYVYFYEDFLKAYDKDMRKGRGVYYTPPPVVNFIIRAVNDILKDTFGIADGLADRHRVTVLDFATGTGTFLIETLQQIFDATPPAYHTALIREHVLKNIYGFEYMIAPYTIAHLKLSQFLRDRGQGFEMQGNERLQIYLTNTLEPVAPQYNALVPALSREVEAAQGVKEKPILVITGNPPYSVNSKNPSHHIKMVANKKGTLVKKKIFTAIGALIEDYKKINGKPLNEANSKNLQDDYVKFIRFAQHKMDTVDEGMVAIITNHSFLDNATFRGMRHSLMQTFNQIYLFDLHGNTKKKETDADGHVDKNVFDIEQGVAISLFIKKKDAPHFIKRADIFGPRKAKYRLMLEADIQNVAWQDLHPVAPYYLFAPQDADLRTTYDTGWMVSDIFNIQSTGIKTHRDHFVIDIDRTALKQRIEEFKDLSISDQQIGVKYSLENNRDWNISEKRRKLSSDKLNTNNLTQIMYRPFDSLSYFHHVDVVDFPRNEVMRHIIAGSLCLGVGRQFGVIGSKDYDIVTITNTVIDTNYFRRGGVGTFPLYLYNFPEDRKPKTSLFDADIDPFAGRERIENFDPAFRAFVDARYGKTYTPEQIMGYIYAVLHSPSYRVKYLEFLKIDFPRIPFVADAALFEQMSAIGTALIAAHLLQTVPKTIHAEPNAIGQVIGKPVYKPDTRRLYYNDTAYFADVPPDVWDFTIGGYQVLDKYLKYRKGRLLSLDEAEHIGRIVNALAFTRARMEAIDALWQA